MGAWEFIQATTDWYSRLLSQFHDDSGGAVSPYIQTTELPPSFQLQSPALPPRGAGVDVGPPAPQPVPLESAVQLAEGVGVASPKPAYAVVEREKARWPASRRLAASASRAAAALRLSIRRKCRTPWSRRTPSIWRPRP
jgi:hypothetical protein